MIRLTALSIALLCIGVSGVTLAKRGPAALPDEVYGTGRYNCNVTVFPKMKIAGEFGHDRGCAYSSITIGGTRFAKARPATARGLAKLGWKRASNMRRRQLAIAWIERVISRLDDFRVASSGGFAGFHRPKATSNGDRSVTVKLWLDTTSNGMLEPKWRTWIELTVSFDGRGRLIGTKRGKGFREPFFKN